MAGKMWETGGGMVLTPLAAALEQWGQVSLVATDMDGTLTRCGKFTSELLQALEALAGAGILVIVVTGRSAGWIEAVNAYLPIAGAIAENGGVFYGTGAGTGEILSPGTAGDRAGLRAMFGRLREKLPQLQESGDNRFRLTDWTFDVEGLSREQLQGLGEQCRQGGWSFTYSTVQCHIKPRQQDKGMALLTVLQRYFAQYSLERVVTVGDSPNDVSLFDRRWFSRSVGVANLKEYQDQLAHLPIYLASYPESEGFCQLAKLLLQSRRQV